MAISDRPDATPADMAGHESAATGAATIDPRRFREVLGQYLTGVCLIAAMIDGQPTGMIVGSFTSASLDPPLIAFFVTHSSASWARLRASSGFCVNILGADQEALCRRLSSRDPDKFAGLVHRLSPGGQPIVDGAVAWVECVRHAVLDAGDHAIVLGLVRALDRQADGLPLLFFRGGYGGFTPLSLITPDTGNLLATQLRLLDRTRMEMERIATDVPGQCVATMLVRGELIVAASAGQPHHGASVAIGKRLPFTAPLGATFAAWSDESATADWTSVASADAADGYRTALRRIRAAGVVLTRRHEDSLRDYIGGLSNAALRPGSAGRDELLARIATLTPDQFSAGVDTDIRMISVPVFGTDGTVVLALSVSDYPLAHDRAVIAGYVTRLQEGAARIAAAA